MSNPPSDSRPLHYIPLYETVFALAVVGGSFFPLFMPVAAILVTLLGFYRLRQPQEQTNKHFWLAYTLVGLFLLASSLIIVRMLL